MKPEQLCMGCMSVNTSGRCETCGYDESKQRSPLALPHRTLLNSRFVAGRVLGKPGGFGVTYLGWDMTLETRVAIKEYLPRDHVSREAGRTSVAPHSDEDGEEFKYGLTQFLQEARTLARFNHAAIVRVRDFFEANGTAYMVMDYYEGKSLAEYLNRQGGRIPEQTAVNIMMPILDGLREVHDQGFLHRDIKPHNIYLTENSIPILLDFGATRFAMGERSRSLSVVLTPGYAPYEQYHRKGKQGPWTDIYACGATLYAALTGKAPPEATERMIDDDLVPPEKIVPGISSGVSSAVMRCLEKAPENRPGDVRTLQDLLMGNVDMLIDDVIDPSPEPPPVDIPEPAPKPHPEPAPDPKPKPGVMKKMVLMMLLLILTGGGIWWMGIEKEIPVEKTSSDNLNSAGQNPEKDSAAESKKMAQSPPDQTPSKEITNSIGQTFRLIQPGSFMMGSPESEPERNSDETRHHVTLSQAYYMQTTEVTQSQWKAVMGENPSRFKDCGGDCPVEQVSWEDVQRFTEKLNRKESTDKYRLPTEAEWEYACRAGTDTPFSFGKCLGTDQANYDGDYPLEGCPEGKYRGKTVPVAGFPPNDWGLYNMHGNVWEWCRDWYGDYPSEAVTDPKGPSSGSFRVHRGGGWSFSAGDCRSAYRSSFSPDYRSNVIGFRLLRTP